MKHVARNDTRKYLTRVSRHLCCLRSTKAEILEGLADELEQGDYESYEKICEALGTPEQTAERLMDEVDQEEKRKVYRSWIALGIAFLLIALVVIGMLCIYRYGYVVVENSSVVVYGEAEQFNE